MPPLKVGLRGEVAGDLGFDLVPEGHKGGTRQLPGKAKGEHFAAKLHRASRGGGRPWNWFRSRWSSCGGTVSYTPRTLPTIYAV